MPTQISDAGASLKITSGTQVRNVMKTHIIEITVIKTNIIKIDIGQGPLYNIFILFSDVSSPVLSNPDALRDQLNAWCQAVAGGSGIDPVSQGYLSQISSTAGMIFDRMDLLTEPVLVDDSNPNMIYEGYADISTPETAAQWSIKRITQQGDLRIVKWAGGNKDFTKRWTERETIQYS